MPRPFNLDNLRDQADVFLPQGEGRETDIVIPIMGPTGVGKSTFVNNVLGKVEAEVSDGFKSCTKQLAHYFIDVPPSDSRDPSPGSGGRIVLVDTPGFDDTELSDSEILRRIAVWLAASYHSNMKVGGVIYMYPIYPNRMTRNDRSNVKVFQKICGDQGLSKVILTTTRWNICPEDSGQKRETELRENFWSDMLSDSAHGTKAQMARLDDRHESAWKLINTVLTRRADSQVDGVILTIQKQIVDKSKKLKNTDAAQELRRKLEELLKESGTSPTQARKEKLRALAAEAAQLRLPLGTRIRKFLGFNSLTKGAWSLAVMPRKIKSEPGDVFIEQGQGRSDDIVIPIMGPTGSGKSTFINNVLGKEPGSVDAAPVSDGVNSCTEALAHYTMEIKQDSIWAKKYRVGGRRIVLVDTPGFDGTRLSDTEILRRIAVWLTFSYDSKMRVGGLIYMYRIWPNRMSRNDRSNISIFQKICGENCLSTVVVATTFWDRCPPEVGERRKKELADVFWTNMPTGSEQQAMPEPGVLWDSYESAHDLLKHAMTRFADSPLNDSGHLSLAPTTSKRVKARANDVYLKEGDGRKGDIVILIMGPSKSGKSTFINNVLEREIAQVSEGYACCTSKLAHYFLEPPYPNWVEGHQLGEQRIVLVDTPGVSGDLGDSEIRRRIAVWLSSAYKAKMKIGGIVYMAPLEPRPITRSDRESIEAFQRLCTDEGLGQSVTFATTRWDLCRPDDLGVLRKSLEDAFWDQFPLLARNSQDSDSATHIMSVILTRYADSRIDGFILNLQEQLINKGKKLKHTDAAQELRLKLETLLKESGSLPSQDRKDKLRDIAVEAARLRLSLGTRIKNFLSLV